MGGGGGGGGGILGGKEGGRGSLGGWGDSCSRQQSRRQGVSITPQRRLTMDSK